MAKKNKIQFPQRYERYGQLIGTEVQLKVDQMPEEITGTVRKAPMVDKRQVLILETADGEVEINIDKIIIMRPLTQPKISAGDLPEVEQDNKLLPCNGTRKVSKRPCKFPMQAIYDLCRGCPNRMPAYAPKRNDTEEQ